MRYFAYASNLDPARMRDERGIAFRTRERADLPGFRLAFNKPDPGVAGAALANIVGDPQGTVQGALYEVTEADLERLDRLEGVPEGRYTRATVMVRRAADGTIVTAQAYIGAPDDVRSGLAPRRAYLAHILHGRDLLDPDYVARLEAIRVLDT